MEPNTRQQGFLGIQPRWLDMAAWLFVLACMLVLAWWSVPRQMVFVLFMAATMLALFSLALARPVWSQCLLIALLPGVTTVSVTILNRLNTHLFTAILNRPAQNVDVGVFGPLTLFLALAFVLGIWLRAWLRGEETAPNGLRVPLIVFAALTLLSALVSVWRYSDLWPIGNHPYCDQIINIKGDTAEHAMPTIVWTLANYVTGPLLFLALCHTAWHARRKSEDATTAPAWIARFIIAPILSGSLAPLFIGLYQIHDVWFGANKVYVWPWMKRINATFFDSNALGSFVLLFVPWVLMAVGFMASKVKWRWTVGLPLLCAAVGAWMLQDRYAFLFTILPDWLQRLTWLVRPSWLLKHSMQMRLCVLAGVVVVIAGACAALRHWRALLGLLTGLLAVAFIGTSIQLTMHAGSRTAIAGVVCIGAISLLFMLVGTVRRAQGRVPPWLYRALMAAVVVLYCGLGVHVFYRDLPMVRDKLVAKYPTLPFTKRIATMPLGSATVIYNQIVKDRGPYARLALHMMGDVPLTGVGLGCFVTELQNWKREIGETIYVPDTACNYYLQVGAEQGLIGLVAALAIFWCWWLQWWRAMRDRGARSFWAFIGAGMAGMMLMFLFGMHTLAHEICCLYWVFVAQPFVAVAASGAPRRRVTYVWLVVLIVCGIYVSVAATQLSLTSQRARFGWTKREGFHAVENWRQGRGSLKIRHTREHATDMISADGLIYRQTWSCLHPDITTRPVRVTFTLGDTVTNVVVADNEWREWRVAVPWQQYHSSVRYEIVADRTWKGEDRGGTGDTRQIGVTLQVNSSWLDARGMFDQETWATDGGVMSAKPYRWSSASGEVLVRNPQAYLRVPVMVGNPDVTGTPVVATFSINGCAATSVVYRAPGWYVETLCVRSAMCSNPPGDYMVLGVGVNRTWHPADFGINDTRNLGVAIGPTEQLSDIGFSKMEKWQTLFNYKWAGAEARWTQRADSAGTLVVQYMLSHPDIATHPVKLSLCINGRPAYDVVSTNAGWCAIELAGTPAAWNEIEAKVDHTWKPSAHGLNDERTLGFAVKF